MSILRTPGITGTSIRITEQSVNPTLQITLDEPKYTIAGEDSELMQRIGMVVFRVFLIAGAIGLMVTLNPIAIALGVLLFLGAVCTLPRAKDQ